MSEIAKTKWLPRHLLSFSFNIYILSCRTELMSYDFSRYEYHYLALSVSSFGKTILNITIGRNERLEQAHDVYKRMSDEYRNVDDRHMGNHTVGVDEGKDVTKDLKGFWRYLVNR